MKDRKPEGDRKPANSGNDNGKRLKSFFIFLLYCAVGALIGLALRGGA